ncbi:MAG: phage holin family protein [Actinomycetaceae bacterium]|nr:phage holin family protein [Actinomycetaceae bacterium]
MSTPHLQDPSRSGQVPPEASGPSSLPGTTPAPPSIGTLFAAVSAQIQTLVRGEVDLIKVNVTSIGKKYSKAGVFLGIAGVVALYLLGWTLHSIELALALVVPAWAAALIVTGILLLIVLIAALLGLSHIKKANSDRETFQEDLRSNIDADVAAVKKGLGK